MWAVIYNRSVPTNVMIPHVHYRDVLEAVTWLGKAFGFEEHFRYGDTSTVSGSQIHLGNAWLMIRRAASNEQTPGQLGFGTQSLTIFVEDVEGYFERAKAGGAKILEEPHETEYGEFQFAMLDYEGRHWVVARHARDADPASWGATVINPLHRASR
jgi:uncharacterized glyoxalase superfamily protein PhnB